MSKMCQAYESEETTLDDVCISLASNNSRCRKCDHGDESLINNDDMDWLSMDASPSSTPYGTPIFSRESSFSSFTSCFSSLGGSLHDSESEEEIELQDTGQLRTDSPLTDEFMEEKKWTLIQVDESKLRHGAAVDDGACFHVPADENISHDQHRLEAHGDITKENLDAANIILDSNLSSEPHDDHPCDTCLTQSDVIEIEEVTSLPMPASEIIPLNQQVTELDGVKENTIVFNNILNTEPDMKPISDTDHGNECMYPVTIPSFDSDSFIWLPPEPTNKEDDVDVVSNSDDEIDDNSTEWGRPTFSVSFEERSKENREDQLKKIMSEVMNGQFKILVSRFLAAEGFCLSDEGTDEGWLDIVASLSWNAALLVKPDANSGDAMDPGLYIKVKCIASGSRQQSEVINGLVFKKSAAHKQMRANIKHPKLLLLQGALGHCSKGLSSMNLMKQESEQLERTLSDMIERCHPDVMLVEKAVSRISNEFIQKRGVTVVSDMNMYRLERIARCTGSSIMLLQDVLTKPNLIKQCESIRFEKFFEEHDIAGEDGRRVLKTYLFLEGFPKPLGCTILLKGAPSEELKKIKSVLHYTVFAAYHLILEASFFADQKLFTADRNTRGKENCSKSDRLLPDKYIDTVRHSIPTCDMQSANMEEVGHNTEKSVPLHLRDSKIKNSRDPADGELIDKKAIQSYSSLPVSPSSTDSVQDKSSSDCAEPATCDSLDKLTFPAICNKVTMQKKDACGGSCLETVDDGKCIKTGDALNTQDILISMSSQHIKNQAVCEQSHLSRITYYGYFDTSLGRYLQDTLLNEKHICLSCGEPPESHMYSYTHYNGTLTVHVKRFPLESSLSGGHQGRIWMWTRCLRCNAKPTQRVILSSSACNLSFGKFLELSFSTHSSAKKLSTCGHLLHRDCLRFFGIGSKVAMFRYSSVEIYSASKPPLMLEFSNQNRKYWLDIEVNAVLHKWTLLFTEVHNVLQDLKSRYSSEDRYEGTNISVYGRLLLDVAGVLAQEKNEIEVSLKESDQIVKLEGCAHEILSLNWLYQQFFLGLYVWDVRLHHIIQYIKVNSASFNTSAHESTEDNELNNSDSPLCPDHDERLSPAYLGEVSVLFTSDEQTAPSRVNESHLVAIPSDDTRKWVWKRFSQVEMEYKKELQYGSLDKFHLVNRYTPLCSSLTHHKHQTDLGYFIVGPGASILLVVEEEISSIIAYALAISEQGFYSEAAFVKDEVVDRRKIDNLASSNMDKDASLLPSVLSRNVSTLSSEESTSGFYDSFLSALKDLHPEICVNNEKIPLKNKYTVVCIYAKQFRDLRKICCPSEITYISSISRCKSWNAQGGKSKVFFAKSLDDRFIIKQIKKTEFDSFIKFGLEYFKHFRASQVSSNPTCLAKILGIYQVKEYRNGKETRANFMIMENLLFGHNIVRKYDLKGALFSRYVPDSKNPEKVLLDQNFIEHMRTMPIYIEGRAKNLMERAIWNDSSFLSNMNVMDYSLFVGVDKQKKELVFGIIDYLRQYTWDKQLESWVKTSLVVPKNQTPTVISPREYRLRFRAFISQYFLSIPDA